MCKVVIPQNNMAKNIIEYRCLLISPSDVVDERDALEEVIHNWNAHIGKSLGTRVEPVRWERHSTPELGDEPQSILNNQLLEDSDLGTAIFWSKIGTPTSKHLSGSVEEIEELLKNGSNVMIYFSDMDIPQSKLDISQYEHLKQIKEYYYKKGIVASFNDIPNLKEQFYLHLTTRVSSLLNRDKNFSPVKDEILTAPKPDVRVVVNNAFLMHPSFDVICFLSVEIQNHSPVTVYVGNVHLKQKSDSILVMPGDYLRKNKPLKDKLEPGESFSYAIDPANLIEYRDTLENVVFRDKVGRRYEADKNNFLEKMDLVIQQYKENGENKLFGNRSLPIDWEM